ncbi:membrane protein insertase YidC [Nocardioides insulae]|uniref:membrane protein insertase YidC n=1 Tax=Nocardioides insulae TaxID=394734 RepID=UPI00055F6A6F|nr:membrane protein insertase YidC [Nocardioides insulae]
MTPLYYAVSGIMLAWHNLFSLFLDPAGGWSWVLSIVGLTVVIRALLIPIFVKQIKSSRNMQLIQPKVKELQKKYGHDRERLAQETMKLYKETGTNPFASCLPLLLQMPIFFALFRLINHAANDEAKGFLSQTDVNQFSHGEIFGAPISATLTDSISGPDQDLAVVIVAVFLVISMTATTFFTQRQLMAKNMPKDAMSGPYAQQQKLLLYVLPVVFAVSGIAFPIGVMIYWTTSNLWTMGQQFYIIRNNPAPGTDAFKAKQERDRLKADKKGGVALAESEVDVEVEPETRRPAQRQQPKRQTREQRKKGGPGSSGTQNQGKNK